MEKKLSLDELDQVSGGGELEETYNILQMLGVDFNEVAKMPKQEALQYMVDILNQNGYS